MSFSRQLLAPTKGSRAREASLLYQISRRRPRPQFWSTLCRYTYNGSEAPEVSENCRTGVCRFGIDCYFGHHGDRYDDDPDAMPMRYIRGTAEVYRANIKARGAKKRSKKRERSEKHGNNGINQGITPSCLIDPLGNSCNEPSMHHGQTIAEENQKNEEHGGKDSILTSEQASNVRITSLVKEELEIPRMDGSAIVSGRKLWADIDEDSEENDSENITPTSTTFLKNVEHALNSPQRLQQGIANHTMLQSTVQLPQDAFTVSIPQSHPLVSDPLTELPDKQSELADNPTMEAQKARESPELESHSYHGKCQGNPIEPLNTTPVSKHTAVLQKQHQHPPITMNPHYLKVVKFIRALDAPPDYVEWVKEYLDRLVIQWKDDPQTTNERIISDIYERLTEDAWEDKFAYEENVNETFALCSQNDKNVDQFRKESMVKWFSNRFKGRRNPAKPYQAPGFTGERNWYMGSSQLMHMSEFFASEGLAKYLALLQRLMLQHQVKLTQQWRRSGANFLAGWVKELDYYAREAICIKALNNIHEHWEIDFGWEQSTGLGKEYRDFANLAEWCVEAAPRDHARDPGIIPFLIYRLTFFRDFSSPSSSEPEWTLSPSPVFPVPPKWLFDLLPQRARMAVNPMSFAGSSQTGPFEVNVSPTVSIEQQRRSQPISVADIPYPVVITQKEQGKRKKKTIVSSDVKVEHPTHFETDVSHKLTTRNRPRANSLEILRGAVDAAKRRRESVGENNRSAILPSLMDVRKQSGKEKVHPRNAVQGQSRERSNASKAAFPFSVDDDDANSPNSRRAFKDGNGHGLNFLQTHNPILPTIGSALKMEKPRQTLTSSPFTVAEEFEDCTLVASPIASRKSNFSPHKAYVEDTGDETDITTMFSPQHKAGNKLPEKPTQAAPRIQVTKTTAHLHANTANKAISAQAAISSRSVPFGQNQTGGFRVGCVPISENNETPLPPIGQPAKGFLNDMVDHFFHLRHSINPPNHVDPLDLPLMQYMEMVTLERNFFLTCFCSEVLRLWEEHNKGKIWYNPTKINIAREGADIDLFADTKFDEKQRKELGEFFGILQACLDEYGINVKFVELESKTRAQVKAQNEINRVTNAALYKANNAHATSVLNPQNNTAPKPGPMPPYLNFISPQFRIPRQFLEVVPQHTTIAVENVDYPPHFSRISKQTHHHVERSAYQAGQTVQASYQAKSGTSWALTAPVQAGSGSQNKNKKRY